MHVCPLVVRSYELDAFGHVNHAVYLNYFEHARFAFLEAAGFPPAEIMARDQGIHVVRVEVDYRRELKLGYPLEIRTGVDSFRNTSMTLVQEARSPGRDGPIFAEARVVIVWVGPDGRPVRIPDDIRSGLGALA
jgi:YbgC/YbaW family acyl-CoA thioester hydrolase